VGSVTAEESQYEDNYIKLFFADSPLNGIECDGDNRKTLGEIKKPAH